MPPDQRPAAHTPSRRVRTDRPGPWLAGASGERILLLDPENTPIQLPTILHALAQINRFGGHAVRPYSILEHSVMVGQIAFHLSGRDPMARACGMFHDAHEAYVGDMPTPMKALLGYRWEDLENAWCWRVRRAIFGINTGWIWSPAMSSLVKRADVIALYAERRALLPGEVADGWGPPISVEDHVYAKDLARGGIGPGPDRALCSAMLDSLTAAGLDLPMPEGFR